MAMLTVVARSSALVFLVACGSGGTSSGGGFGSPNPAPANTQPSSSSAPKTGGNGAAPATPSTTSQPDASVGTGTGTGKPTAPSNSSSPSNPSMPSSDAGSTASGSGSGDGGKPPPGPMKGDPNKPMVSIPNVACGAPNLTFGSGAPTVSIDGRDTAVLYPCAHQGAPVTFFMFLHGTLSDGQKIPFTMNAWPIHTLVDQYNIVEVVPQSAMGGTQWGNGDNGTDLPYLYDVISWVYSTFGTQFDIRSEWIQGGSWGAFYLSTTFACDPKVLPQLNGVQLIVGNGCPTCSGQLSCMVGQQELQLGNGSALTDAQAEMYATSSMFNIAPYAMQHNCQAETGPTDVGNVKWWDFPSCDKGWVYNYMMAPGQHADAWDPAAVLKTTEEIKALEQ